MAIQSIKQWPLEEEQSKTVFRLVLSIVATFGGLLSKRTVQIHAGFVDVDKPDK